MSVRHRITILNHEPNHDRIISSFNQTALHLNNDVPYTREDRFTIPFNNKFNHIKQLRISIGDFESDVFHYNSNGLTIYAVPSTTDKAAFFNEINNFVSKLFNIPVNQKNWIVSKTALLLNTHRYSGENINRLLTGLSNYDDINTDVMDLYYENNRLVFSFINKEKFPVLSKNKDHHQEIGIFLVDENSTTDDLILSGVRVLFDEQEPMKKTLFHIKPKFRSLSAESVVIDNGLHPKLKTVIRSHPQESDVTECKLYYYMTLNKHLFIDKYNLGENIDFVFNFGNTDLELPEYKVHEWGNEILLELKNWDQKQGIEVLLNLHSRYQVPGTGLVDSDKKLIHINQPVVFFGCDDVNEKSIVNYNPFINQYSMGNKYSQFFTNNTIFYESFNATKLEVGIPVPNKKFELINLITSLSLIIGIFIILLQILNTKVNGKKSR